MNQLGENLALPTLRAVILAGIAAIAPAFAQDIYIHGKVVMEDGSPPVKAAAIYRYCPERLRVWVTGTNKLGEYSWTDPFSMGYGRSECVWRAVLNGYISNEVDFDRIQKSNLLPDFVLHPESEDVPAAAGARYTDARKLVEAKDWAGAERLLQALVKEFPKSAPVRSVLGIALQGADKIDEARAAYQAAIQLGPAVLASYHLLALLEMEGGDFKAAEKIAATGVRNDSANRMPVLYLDLARARFHLGSDDAEAAARKLIGLDAKHEYPSAEVILAQILESQQDYRSAAAHYRRYLELSPEAPEAGEVRARAESLETQANRGQTGELAPASPAAERSIEGTTEIEIPGGLRGLTAVARLKDSPSGADFFKEYARGVSEFTTLYGPKLAADLLEDIRTYINAATELSAMADAATGRLTLSMDTPANRERTAKALKLIGWRIGKREGADHVEPADERADAPRQMIASSLDIDEVEMAKALSAGGSYRFDIHPGRARFRGVGAWRSVLGGVAPGGITEAFARNPRAAGTYAALADAGAEAADALVASLGLSSLVNRFGEALVLYSSSFTVSGGRADSPGGAAADAAWTALAGVSPANPAAFFPALLQKDQGKLAAFYSALSHADARHQKYFTANAARADQYYKWFRDCDDLRPLYSGGGPVWRQDLLRDAPLDEGGALRFPGGKSVWSAGPGSDDDALLTASGIEALVPLAKIEERRKRPLDAASVKLLADRHLYWRALYPYFERLSALDAVDFQALAAMEKAISGRGGDARTASLGEWHSLVKLAILANAAGTLDDAAAARAFRRACEAVASQDHAAKALAALAEMAGPGDLDEGLIGRLLRMAGERREAFERVRELQRVPKLAKASGATAVSTALAGAVYAALLAPDTLIVSEDPQLLSRHDFSRGSFLFPPTSAELTSDPPGSHFQGGFMTFEETVAPLARAAAPAEWRATPIAGSGGSASSAGAVRSASSQASSDVVFRTDSRLVEVYATVTEGSRYVDEMTRADVTVRDNGKPVTLGAFESCTSPVSLALLLDATGSMRSALPALRGSALRLIDELRSIDSVAVYSFNREVHELQPFTRNKDAARRAVLGVRATGITGLHDAMVRVTRDVAQRSGKKIIVVFTDGSDNASGLISEAVVRRAKSAGIPIYTIAQGEALSTVNLLTNLRTIAAATGGLSFNVRDPGSIASVFEHVSEDVMHGYLMTFQADGDSAPGWHKIEVTVKQGVQSRKVRAREGYFPD
jgi:VWFA-related protein